MSTPPLALPTLAGRSLAGYRVGPLLGRGGLGAVYLAHDARHRPVALKVLDLGGEVADDLLRMFSQEASLCRRLAHPGIVRLLDAGQEGTLAFMAMEYVEGRDLERARASGWTPAPDEALDLLAQVADALAHAHGAGIVHRDLKPANLLHESATGRIKLVDFGLARLADMHRTRTGVLAGTPAYMAPEQLMDAPVDGRTDLYALGVVCFEWLAGRRPFVAASLGELLRLIGRTPAPDVRAFRADVSGGMAALLARLLHSDPAGRPASAAAVAQEARQLRGRLAGP